MPELPEVEVIAADLNQRLCQSQRNIVVKEIEVRDGRLRNPVPPFDHQKNLKLNKIFRRAKYILFDTDKGFLLSHLGMTGSWRIEDFGVQFKKHDHIVLHLNTSEMLIYNDPRRFGMFDFAQDIGAFSQLSGLGPEPLTESFALERFCLALKNRKQSIKVVIMDSKVVVGVGNIYASEALFRAGVRPSKKSNKVSKEETKKIFNQIKKVLSEAIEGGGSTLRDYRNLKGEKGGFQSRHLVYGRHGEKCKKCSSKITSKVLGGRSTFWCPSCQS